VVGFDSVQGYPSRETEKQKQSSSGIFCTQKAKPRRRGQKENCLVVLMIPAIAAV
jgi:hypothetical protein